MQDPRPTAPSSWSSVEPLGPGFLGVDCDYDSARAVLLPVPYDLTTSYAPGTRRGPQAIIEASHFVELNDEEMGGDLYASVIHTLPAVPPVVSGPSDMVAAVEKAVSAHVSAGKFVGMLGGEHSVTFGAVSAHRSRWPDLSVLQLDAHADLRDQYEGSRFSHACVMRRVRECVPAVQVGIRSLSSEESAHVRHQGLPLFTAREFLGGALKPESLFKGLSNSVYVTVDCDVFDPAVMPSVGTPEPGGLGWYDVVDLLEALSRARRIVGFDVVELNPLPGLTAPDFMAARLVYRLLGLALRSQGIVPA